MASASSSAFSTPHWATLPLPKALKSHGKSQAVLITRTINRHIFLHIYVPCPLGSVGTLGEVPICSGQSSSLNTNAGKKGQKEDGLCGPSQAGARYSLRFLRREQESMGRGSCRGKIKKHLEVQVCRWTQRTAAVMLNAVARQCIELCPASPQVDVGFHTQHAPGAHMFCVQSSCGPSRCGSGQSSVLPVRRWMWGFTAHPQHAHVLCPVLMWVQQVWRGS